MSFQCTQVIHITIPPLEMFGQATNHDWSGNPEAPVLAHWVGLQTLFGHPSDPNTTSSSLHLPQCFSFKNLLRGCVLSARPTRTVAADIVVLDV